MKVWRSIVLWLTTLLVSWTAVTEAASSSLLDGTTARPPASVQDNVVAAEQTLSEETTRGQYPLETTAQSLYGTTFRIAIETANNATLRRFDLAQRTIDWVAQQNGGFFDSDLLELGWEEDKQTNAMDPSNSRLILYAKQDIEPEALLFRVPRDCAMFDPNDEVNDEYDELHCGTARELANQLKSRLSKTSSQEGDADADDSPRGPYLDLVRELYNVQENGHVAGGYGILPNMFSNEGQNLLKRVLGYSGGEATLPPYDIYSWVNDEWIIGCQGSDEPIDQLAASLVIQHQWNGKIYPIMEFVAYSRMMQWVNVVAKFDNDGVSVYSATTIKAGQELTISLVDEGSTAWSTSDVFRDAGMIESLHQSQQWIFRKQKVAFQLQQVGGDVGFQWLSDPIQEKGLVDLDLQLERLTEELWQDELVVRPTFVPEHEWLTIVKYATALTTALETLLGVVDRVDSCLDHGSNEPGCQILSDRYDSLETPYGVDDYNTETCDSVKTLDLSHFHVVEQIQSPFQKITYLQDPGNNNTCFDLDNIYQQCTSYRAHYHEIMVHVPARFLPEVKRVLFVGGGDSMLLHEILKYPSIELVIGLELDQQVTRSAFKYFGSLPHWDHDKVQWWYGDAAQSLLMLPKEYFGTFDLVLVDLSETVMANTVSKDLDILSALSLLLKPEGIFVKNEMYLERLSDLFQYTVQLHFYDIPLVCSQVVIMGSRAVDFINVDLKDHEVETLFDQVTKFNDNFEVVHDYRDKPDAKDLCQSEIKEDEPDEPESSPGILMILEAEQTEIDLTTPDTLASAIETALQREGLSELSTRTTVSGNQGPVVIVVLQEGYIVARSWSSKRYIGFDVHLWGSFHKLEAIEKSLIVAVGSSSQKSSLRMIATGMHGTATFDDDLQMRGPKYQQNCHVSSLPETGNQSPGKETIDVILEESFASLMLEKDASVGVICGSNECSTHGTLKNNKHVAHIVPLVACESIGGSTAYLANATARLYGCEKDILDTLSRETRVIDVLVLDAEAPLEMAQIIRKLISRIKTKRACFSEDLVVLAPVSDQAETWRRVFVDNMRLFYRKEPAFYGSIEFTLNGSVGMEMNVFSSGDPRFISRINQLPSRIHSHTGATGKVTHIGGTSFTMQEDMNWTQFFSHQDYNQHVSAKKWAAQEPEGLQTIFQLSGDASNISREILLNLLRQSLSTVDIEGEIDALSDAGEGLLLVATWAEGHVALLWDGRRGIGINLFTFEETADLVDDFLDTFTQAGDLKVALRDEMPRGVGAVNKRSEILGRQPHFSH